MNVPLLDLTRQYESIRKEIDEAVLGVIASGRFILGPEVEAFEREVAAFCGVEHAVGVASGTDALLLSLRALGVGPGDRVLLPSFTFFATAGVVHNVGATPVFVDVDPRTFNIDPAHVRETLANLDAPETVKAIIPVHLYGQIADMDELTAIAEEHGIAVVEDAAQAIGAEYGGARAGSIGELGCFSFFPTKNLGAYGDGGVLTSRDAELADRVRLLRTHGARPKYYHHLVGINSRLDALQAAVLRVKLAHLEAWSARRAQLAERYDELLRGIEGLDTPYRAPDRTHIFHQYTIRVSGDRRDDLQRGLKEKGIGSLVYYPLCLHRQECFAHLGYREGQLPVCEQASRQVLSLPVFPEITTEEQTYVADSIREILTGP